jgi:RecA-family ATPase
MTTYSSSASLPPPSSFTTRLLSADEINRARSMPIESAINGRGLKLRRFGAELVGPCPVCGDGVDRFSINPKKGKWFCRHCDKGGGDAIGLVRFLDGTDFPEAVTSLIGGRSSNGNGSDKPQIKPDREPPSSTERKIVATYDYTDRDGALLYQVLRYDPKDFSQRRPDGNSGWISNAGDRKVPYRWPELAKFPDATVFACEGEKDAIRVASLGHCATTAASGDWKDDCVRALAGRDVIILEDNDAPGKKKALAAATKLHGTAKSIRVVSLPDLPYGKDVSDWLDVDPRRAEKLIEICLGTPEWTPPSTDKAEAPASEAVHLPLIDIFQLEGMQIPERQWLVPMRIPARNVTLISGDGGVGKSILTLQLAVAARLGRDWLGSLVSEPGPVIVFCAEDDRDEIHRRIALIAEHYHVTFAQLAGLYILPMAGQDALMAIPNRAGVIEPTKLYGQFLAKACDIKPNLIVIDNAADVYAGNENDRAQVRGFIGLMRHIAMTANAAVVVTSHPSLTGITTKTGLSGSTAWNASVRSRMYLRRPNNIEDQDDTDLRTLEVMKSNYGRVGETINCRWEKGMFVPVAGSSPIEVAAAEQAADNLFLKLLGRFNEQGLNISPNPCQTYAPIMFAKDPDASGTKTALFEAAMRRLLAKNRIHILVEGPRSHRRTRLVFGPKP